MSEFCVIGSCVTRDAFEFGDIKDSLTYYHSRSNLASLTHTLPIDELPDFEEPRHFEKRCAQTDMNKSFNLNHRGKIVIFDFIDDRFPIARRNDRVFTANWRMLATASEQWKKGIEFTPHFRPQNWSQVSENLKLFYDKNRELFHENYIIIHKASFNPYYDGQDPDREKVDAMLRYYDFLFNEIMTLWPVDYTIDLRHLLTSPSATPADHRWGHTPFHYSDNYNELLASELAGRQRIFSSKYKKIFSSSP
ncbi:DUF6270 domain-containing protein [Pseudophaeobacter leonis]|uniref:DUF6270 domain-containing protein n=1 Tax=Pseudophaeobacter leonis TaxID=1144477 RepID=UPI0009F50E4B|nr:DUF6270 domain-containing protein [Pseudophaeobacter leonis]